MHGRLGQLHSLATISACLVRASSRNEGSTARASLAEQVDDLRWERANVALIGADAGRERVHAAADTHAAGRACRKRCAGVFGEAQTGSRQEPGACAQVSRVNAPGDAFEPVRP